MRRKMTAREVRGRMTKAGITIATAAKTTMIKTVLIAQVRAKKRKIERMRKIGRARRIGRTKKIEKVTKMFIADVSLQGDGNDTTEVEAAAIKALTAEKVAQYLQKLAEATLEEGEQQQPDVQPASGPPSEKFPPPRPSPGASRTSPIIRLHQHLNKEPAAARFGR